MHIISVQLILKIRVPASTMSQCYFCSRTDPSVEEICCNEGQQACGCCIMGKNVNQGTICEGCHIPLRKKIFGLRAKIQLNLRNLQDKRGKTLGMGNKDHDSSDMHMMNMMNTAKKNQTFKNNQNQMNEDNYRNYNQGQYNMGQAYYPNQMQPGVYSPYCYPPMNVPPMNPYMSSQMGSMPMAPYQMNMMPPQYNNQNWNPHTGNANHPNMSNLSQCMSPEEYEQFTQFRMMRNASKTIMPHHNSKHEEEKGQGRYWHGEHNDVVYNRCQSKTTDMMDQSTMKSKFSAKMTRSNSASNLLQR